jgi:hypothetical protein
MIGAMTVRHVLLANTTFWSLAASHATDPCRSTSFARNSNDFYDHFLRLDRAVQPFSKPHSSTKEDIYS